MAGWKHRPAGNEAQLSRPTSHRPAGQCHGFESAAQPAQPPPLSWRRNAARGPAGGIGLDHVVAREQRINAVALIYRRGGRGPLAKRSDCSWRPWRSALAARLGQAPTPRPSPPSRCDVRVICWAGGSAGEVRRGVSARARTAWPLRPIDTVDNRRCGSDSDW